MKEPSRAAWRLLGLHQRNRRFAFARQSVWSAEIAGSHTADFDGLSTPAIEIHTYLWQADSYDEETGGSATHRGACRGQ